VPCLRWRKHVPAWGKHGYASVAMAPGHRLVPTTGFVCQNSLASDVLRAAQKRRAESDREYVKDPDAVPAPAAMPSPGPGIPGQARGRAAVGRGGGLVIRQFSRPGVPPRQTSEKNRRQGGLNLDFRTAIPYFREDRLGLRDDAACAHKRPLKVGRPLRYGGWSRCDDRLGSGADAENPTWHAGGGLSAERRWSERRKWLSSQSPGVSRGMNGAGRPAPCDFHMLARA
jgi:hypothetical protein